MKIAICDDEKYYRDLITTYVQCHFTNKSNLTMNEFCCGEDLIEYYMGKKTFDLIFLDIEMNNSNGIETAQKIREIDENVIIIFVTSYTNYVFETFKVNAFQFIKKPIDKQSFENDFSRAINLYNKKHHKYEVKFKNKISILEIKNITHIEVYDHSICVYCNSKCYKKSGKLKEEILNLKPYDFIQCHKSIIVNMHHIKSIEESTIILKDNNHLILSKKYKKSLLESFNKFLSECCI